MDVSSLIMYKIAIAIMKRQNSYCYVKGFHKQLNQLREKRG